MENNSLSNDLMKLESTINKIVMDMQNLVDEIEDIMDWNSIKNLFLFLIF